MLIGSDHTLEAAFEAGTVRGSTRANILSEAASENHFAFAVANATKKLPSVGDVVIGAIIYIPGNNITGVVAGKRVAIYELTPANEAVKSVVHTLVDSEIKA